MIAWWRPIPKLDYYTVVELEALFELFLSGIAEEKDPAVMTQDEAFAELERLKPIYPKQAMRLEAVCDRLDELTADAIAAADQEGSNRILAKEEYAARWRQKNPGGTIER